MLYIPVKYDYISLLHFLRNPTNLDGTNEFDFGFLLANTQL